MVQPIMFYCYPPVYLGLSDSANIKLQSLQNRANKIIGENYVMLDNVILCRNRKIAVDVFKTLHSIGSQTDLIKFKTFSHHKNTRGNRSRLILPQVKTQAGRKSLSFKGSLAFNELPQELRNHKSICFFKRKIKEFQFRFELKFHSENILKNYKLRHLCGGEHFQHIFNY